MSHHSDHVANVPGSEQPVGRVRLSDDTAPSNRTDSNERNTLLARCALGFVMLGLTLLGILVILSGVFVAMPQTLVAHW